MPQRGRTCAPARRPQRDGGEADEDGHHHERRLERRRVGEAAHGQRGEEDGERAHQHDRPLAVADRPGASPTATDTPLGNRLPMPTPSRVRPAAACTARSTARGARTPAAPPPGPHRTAPPGRTGGSGRYPAPARRAPPRVADHDRDGGVRCRRGRLLRERGAPCRDAPLRRHRTHQHDGRDPEHARQAFARTRGARTARPAPWPRASRRRCPSGRSTRSSRADTAPATALPAANAATCSPQTA